MSELKDRIRADLTASMKARDVETTSTLRMLLTAISAEEVAGKQARELSDDEVVTVLTREQKRRKEAAGTFADAGRADRAAAEQAEAEIIATYLPQQLAADELNALIAEAVSSAAEQGLSGGRAMGAVMKSLKPATAGRVDGAELAAAVKAALGLG